MLKLNVSSYFVGRLRKFSQRTEGKEMAEVTDDETQTKVPKQASDTKQPSAVSEYLFKLGRGLLSVLLIWLVGWFGFSHAWIVASYVLYVFWCQKKQQRQQKWLATRYFSDYENLKSLKNLPSWICIPDVENAEWLNKVIAQVWPFVSTMVGDILKNEVELEIQKKMPTSIPLLKSFKFHEADLGNHPLTIDGVKVYKDHVRADEIIMDICISYAGDLEVKVGFGAITAGITKIQLRGQLRVELKPLLPRAPLIGGMTVSFLEVPEFDFDLTNLLNVLDLPGVSSILHECLEEVIQSFIVLPNKVTIPFADDPAVQKALLHQPPMGVLQVKIISGRDLKASDKKIFSKDSSDPYVICKVASHKHKTEIQEDTLNPVWNETFVLFVDTLIGTKIKFDVWDSDPGKDDDLGKADISILDIVEKQNFKEQNLKLSSVKTGSLDVQCGWLTFSDDVTQMQKPSIDLACTAALFVTIVNAKDLPVIDFDKNTCNAFAEIEVQDGKDSKTKQTKTQRHTTDPVWNESFFFTIKEINENSKTTIKIMDHGCEDSLGEMSFNLQNLLSENKMTCKKCFSLENSTAKNPTLAVTLQLKALVKGDAETK